jgi:DNA-binding transcriptional LysR family regulator
MEFRELEAFVAVASESHFGRAAKRLHVSPATLSELIRRLERDLGTPLFIRTTRTVNITAAGEALLASAKTILDEVTAARTAVSRIASGEVGTVRVGVTPPAALTLLPRLVALFAKEAPHVTVDPHRMWRPNLDAALAANDIDVAILFGPATARDGIESRIFCAEPLFVGVRPDHRFASRATVALEALSGDVLGMTSPDLFPAWACCQRQALLAAGVAPRTVVLDDPSLEAARWAEQGDADWILLTRSLVAGHSTTVPLRLEPRYLVPFTLQWSVARAQVAAVARFVQTALSSDLPSGYYTQPGHLHHLRGTGR